MSVRATAVMLWPGQHRWSLRRIPSTFCDFWLIVLLNSRLMFYNYNHGYTQVCWKCILKLNSLLILLLRVHYRNRIKQTLCVCWDFTTELWTGHTNSNKLYSGLFLHYGVTWHVSWKVISIVRHHRPDSDPVSLLTNRKFIALIVEIFVKDWSCCSRKYHVTMFEIGTQYPDAGQNWCDQRMFFCVDQEFPIILSNTDLLLTK